MRSTDDNSCPPGLDEQTWALLVDHVAGRCTPSDAAAARIRLATDPAYAAAYEELHLLWEEAGNSFGLPVSEGRVDQAWARVAATLPASFSPRRITATRTRGSISGLAPPSRSGAAGRWRRRVVVALVLIAAGTGVWWSLPDPLLTPQGVELAVTREVTAPAGERVTLTLEDGSKVALAPGSVLRMPAPFGVGSREVILEGRAYFEVVPDQQRPFLVHTPGLITRVLGTAFDVRAYAGAAAEVAVRSGQVMVRRPEASEEGAKVLTRGDLAVSQPSGAIAVQSGVDVEDLIGWTTGRLTFHRAPLRNVVPELEAWLDLEIVISDPSVAERRLTAAFEDEAPETILETVAALVGAQIERSGRRVTLSPLRRVPE